MPKDDLSDTNSHDSGSDSSSDNFEKPISGESQKKMTTMTEYEKQRMKRVEDNRARMEALGLFKMASSLMSKPFQGKEKKMTREKRKRKGEDDADEEYRPVAEEDDEEISSSGEDEDWSGSRITKGKKKTLTPKKKVQVQKLKSNSDFVDNDDEDLSRAIALSLQETVSSLNEGCSGLPQSPDARLVDSNNAERMGNARVRDETGKRKRRKQVSSRVQMTENELIVHFLQFDEAGKGFINIRDLERMAVTHDFTWTDKELADMIYCFDSDGDGKLSLEDFWKIVGRCNMIQSPNCC